MVVSRCLGMCPPSGIPPLGRCFCWLDRICWCGGWSILSRAVHDYIDPTCPTSLAARRFFGWLRRPA